MIQRGATAPAPRPIGTATPTEQPLLPPLALLWILGVPPPASASSVDAASAVPCGSDASGAAAVAASSTQTSQSPVDPLSADATVPFFGSPQPAMVVSIHAA